jgi:hypothetical protein
MQAILRFRGLGALCLGAGLLSCLPKDTRPPPSSVLVNVTPADATINGISAASTADGWDIAFDTFLVSVGEISLDGSNCSSYSEARYLRVFDALVPGAQKLSESFALGQCDFGFRVANPADDSLLASGARSQDLTFMRTPGTDSYAGVSGVSVYVQGHAQKQGAMKTFAWTFRQQLEYTECANATDAGSVRGLALSQGGAVTVDLEIHGETLFEDSLQVASSVLRFDPFADADTVSGNDDGDISLDELAAVQLTDISAAGNYSTPSGGPDVGKTLRDYAYLGAFPRITRFANAGTCTIQVGHGD